MTHGICYMLPLHVVLIKMRVLHYFKVI